MSDAFDRAIGFILPHECAYAPGHYGDMRYVVSERVSGDSGGLTKWGIDQASHPHDDIENLTQHQAEALYYANYWVPCHCNLLPDSYAIALMDAAVNMGVGTACKMLQNAVGVAPDGQIGPRTVAACVAAGDLGLRQFFALRCDRYRQLAQAPSRAKFLKGWLQRVVDLRQMLRV